MLSTVHSFSETDRLAQKVIIKPIPSPYPPDVWKMEKLI